jgi:hypothetical protein
MTNQRSTSTYNALYSLLKGKTSSRGTSFDLYSFADGSAVIKVSATQGVATVSVNAIIVPIYDKEGKTVVKYRISNDDTTQERKTLYAAGSLVMAMVRDARRFMSRMS